MKPLKVLLISPLPKIDPPCGDITHTQTLLANPPPGVQYENYIQAIDRGTLREHANGRSLKLAWRTGDRPLRETYFAFANKAVNILRNRRVLFWEPFRFFTVKPGEYDLVHVHLFATRFLEIDCPLVISCGGPQVNLYRDARHQGKTRIAIEESGERLFSRALRVNSYSYHVPQARRMLVYTDTFRNYLVSKRVMPRERIDIIPLCLPAAIAPPAAESPRKPSRVVFVANDFVAKGGDTLLAAWRIVRQKHPEAELTMIGSPTPERYAGEPGVVWHTRIPREELLAEVLPSMDVFAYPTECDNISYILLEAMAARIACTTSDYPSMPEVVDHGKAGLVSPMRSVPALVANILQLLEPEANVRFRRAAHARFLEQYSVEKVMPRIRQSYDAALGVAAAGPASIPHAERANPQPLAVSA